MTFPLKSGRRVSWQLSIVFVALLSGACVANGDDQPVTEAATACFDPGQWQVPGQTAAVAHVSVIDQLAAGPVVLLGESHTTMEHHRWQLNTLAALYGRRTDMVIGFEMFPRAVQPVLDAWVNGELGETAFLEQTRWDESWKYDKDLYMPLFQFARQNRIPMVALNVNIELIRQVRQLGWDNVPVDQREGLTRPAPPPPAYADMLAKVFLAHAMAGQATDDDAKPDNRSETEKNAANAAAQAQREQDTGRFIEAQQTWDRAMAEALKSALYERAPFAVGIIGSGHLESGHGVAYQLEDIGVTGTKIALPWDKNQDCKTLVAGVADYVFGLDPADEPGAKPQYLRLGVVIENTKDGNVRVRHVVPDSVAEATDIHVDDLIVEAAGQKMDSVATLVQTIRAQALGTWLPLTIRRGALRLDAIAKFPTHYPETQPAGHGTPKK